MVDSVFETLTKMVKREKSIHALTHRSLNEMSNVGITKRENTSHYILNWCSYCSLTKQWWTVSATCLPCDMQWLGSGFPSDGEIEGVYVTHGIDVAMPIRVSSLRRLIVGIYSSLILIWLHQIGFQSLKIICRYFSCRPANIINEFYFERWQWIFNYDCFQC